MRTLIAKDNVPKVTLVHVLCAVWLVCEGEQTEGGAVRHWSFCSLHCPTQPMTGRPIMPARACGQRPLTKSSAAPLDPKPFLGFSFHLRQPGVDVMKTPSSAPTEQPRFQLNTTKQKCSKYQHLRSRKQLSPTLISHFLAPSGKKKVLELYFYKSTWLEAPCRPCPISICSAQPHE